MSIVSANFTDFLSYSLIYHVKYIHMLHNQQTVKPAGVFDTF